MIAEVSLPLWTWSRRGRCLRIVCLCGKPFHLDVPQGQLASRQGNAKANPYGADAAGPLDWPGNWTELNERLGLGHDLQARLILGIPIARPIPDLRPGGQIAQPKTAARPCPVHL